MKILWKITVVAIIFTKKTRKKERSWKTFFPKKRIYILQMLSLCCTLKGQYHEILFTRLFSSTMPFWSYKRYSMRILDFDEFSRYYSTIKEPRRCRFRRWVWTPLCSLRRGVWTLRCRLHRWVISPTIKAWIDLFWLTPQCRLHQGLELKVLSNLGGSKALLAGG